jgi:HEAT repeat protein
MTLRTSRAKGLSRARRWATPLLLALGLAPATLVLLQAHDQEALASESIYDARERVLSSIPGDASVLINVTDREMPASPDILNLGKRSTRALERCLSDNVDENIRVTCAILLGRLGDRRALPTLQAALADWEPRVRYWVIQALRKIPDSSSFDPLLKLYARKDETRSNRGAILYALGALSDQKAVRVLRRELRAKPEKDAPDVRKDAFAALWSSRHLMAPTTLASDVSYALRSDNKALALTATEASAELRSPSHVGALIPLMEDPNSEIRNKAVYALGRIGDRRATRALLERLPQVREARMLNNIAFALERLDRTSFFEAIAKLIAHKQAIIRLNAAFVVGDVQRPEGKPLLEKALEDPSDYVKTSTIVALGKLGDASAIPSLEKFVDDPNLSIRQEAIYAINALSGNKYLDAVHDKLFNSKFSSVRRRAAITLGKAGDPRARSFLLTCVEWEACRLRDVDSFLRTNKHSSVPQRLLLAWARGRDDLTDLVADMRPAGTLGLALGTVDASLARSDDGQAKDAIDLIGELGDSSAKERIGRHMNSTDTWLRLHTAVAVARLGDKTADQRIVSDMDNLAADWLPAFSNLVSQIEEPDVRGRIAPALMEREKSTDVNVALAATAIRLAWDPDNAIFRMLDALSSQRGEERALGVYYLEKNRSQRVTWLLRRALARETRPHTKDVLRKLLDARPGS